MIFCKEFIKTIHARQTFRPGTELSSCNRELRFSGILLESRDEISAQAENLHAIGLAESKHSVTYVL